MSRLKLRSFIRHTWRSAMSCAVLVAFCVALLPVPLPTAETPLFDSVPFPCQGRGCGCKSAKQCWTSCCCHSPAQRLSWAKRKNVTPPEYAVLSEPSDRSEPITKSEASTKVLGLRKKVAVLNAGVNICGAAKRTSSESLCSEEVKSGEVNRNSHGSPITIAGMSNQNATAKPSEKSQRFSQNARKQSYTISMLALKCQGKSSVFTQLPWVIPSLRPEVVRAENAIEDFLPCLVMALVSIYQQPDTPPPELLSSENCV